MHALAEMSLYVLNVQDEYICVNASYRWAESVFSADDVTSWTTANWTEMVGSVSTWSTVQLGENWEEWRDTNYFRVYWEWLAKKTWFDFRVLQKFYCRFLDFFFALLLIVDWIQEMK